MHLSRRDAIRFGFSTAAGFGLADLLRLRAASSPTSDDTACIFIQLGGGAAQHETFDPKPDAPAEYRGPFKDIATSVPGIRFGEMMPRHAEMMKHLAIVRSITHQEASHIALHVVETGYFLRDRAQIRKGDMPSVGASVSRALEGKRAGGLPAYVSIPRANAYSGPNYLGGQYAAFDVNDDPNNAKFTVPNTTLAKGLSDRQIHDRRALLTKFDQSRRAADTADSAALDDFQRRALEIVTGEKVREAFDLASEPAKLRDEYGRTIIGQRLLLARRLTEAGVPFVVVRSNDWDDHKDMSGRMKKRIPEHDTAVAALIGDLLDRGLYRRVLVVEMGEFGRTPKVNKDGGRDHWPGVNSVVFAGGDYRMGQVIGSTDATGGVVATAAYPPQAVLGMVYRHLGIDPGMTFPDFTGRPRYLLEEREPIVELG